MRLKQLQTFKKDLPTMGELHHSFLESFLTDYILQKLGKQSLNKILKLRITLATQGTLIKKIRQTLR
jgi:hypothetical protein